jgi:MoaA/NifB/PqqE/SkfB family radical SAM enzyme
MTGYKCNNHCVFCYNLQKRNIVDKNTGTIKNEIAWAKKRGAEYLEIIGGEQTIRPDMIEIIKFAKNRNFKIITMTTNGSMFAYRDFAKSIIKAGLTRVVFSIHGHNAKMHDCLTQVGGSFKRLLMGVENAKLFGIGTENLGSNTAIVKQNYKSLSKIGNLIYKLGIRNSEFIFVDPTRGGPFDNFNQLVPKISKVAPFIRKCLDMGRKNQIGHWHIRYVPLCYFLDYLDQISELSEKEIFSSSEHLAPDFVNYDVENSRKHIARIKPKKCKPCSKFDLCEGIWKEYYRRYGDSELMPVKSTKR